MDCRPPLRTGLLIGIGLLGLSLGSVALGLAQIPRAPFSVWLVLWTVLPLAGAPLALIVGYRLFGLATARYIIDRDALRVRWGWSVEEAPLAEVTLEPIPEGFKHELRLGRGVWWPGCLVGTRDIPSLGKVEFFSTRPPSGMLMVSTAGRRLAISPPDPRGFLDAFVSATRLGSLRKIPPRSIRPEFFSSRVWDDKLARALILLGLALPLGLLGFLGAASSTLPDLVPFGFDVAGQPDSLGPPTRLLFLPLIAGLCWLADMVLAGVVYRVERDRPLAYGVWGLAGIVGVLIWGSALQLLAGP